MKKILLIISIILISCGTRQKNLNIEKEKTKLRTGQSLSAKTDSNTETESSVDARKHLQEIGLKIKSTGKPYQLQYDGVTFSGDADLDFTNKKETTIVKTNYRTETTYKTEIKAITKTILVTEKYNKNLVLKSKHDSWWLCVLLFLAGLVTIPLIKYFVKK